MTSPDPTPGGNADRDEPDEPGPDEPTQDDLGDGVEHLQQAAREVIAAARTFLDVVEDAVADHAVASSVAEWVGSLGHLVARAAETSGVSRDTPESGGAEPYAGAGGPGASSARRRPTGTGRGSDRVQHIDVS